MNTQQEEQAFAEYKTLLDQYREDHGDQLPQHEYVHSNALRYSRLRTWWFKYGVEIVCAVGSVLIAAAMLLLYTLWMGFTTY